MSNQQETQALELLKLHFGKGASGKWEISGMSGLSIKPRREARTQFFEIADEMIIVQPATFGTTTSFLKQSIVPIVAHVQGERTLRCLGTGFFISCTGLLVTAAHVISDPIERRYGGIVEEADLTWRAQDLHLGVLLPLYTMGQLSRYAFRQFEWSTFLAQTSEQLLPISGVNLKLTSDTAICKVPPLGQDIPYQPLAIVQPGLVGVGMAVGKKAAAIGYGAMHDVELEPTPDGIAGDFAFDLHASTGSIVERFPDNLIARQVPTPGACFSASLELPGGMSGSPIFDHEGVYVHGVVSKGWVGESGVEAFGFGSMLAHSMRVPLRPLDGKSLLELHAQEDHGFAKLSGPGM